VRARFLLAEFLAREPTDLPWTFLDALRLTFVSLGRKTLFLVARLGHQINADVSRQVIGCPAMTETAFRPIGRRKAPTTGASERKSSAKIAQSMRHQETTMLRRPRIAAALCFVAAVASLCVVATESDAARYRSGKHRSVTTKPRAPPAAKEKPKPAVATDQTPTNKNDCLTVSQTLYERAEALSKRAKQSVPREFTRVASNLDESCGEEDFDKARISIDWLNTCLANYTKDYSLGFCTRDKSYFCAINPRSDACLQNQ
jgi:hypothetical protein